jgi:Site-specific recombinases, DNA invertase Pin homologs
METKKIIVIPKREIHSIDILTGKKRKKKVAAYARVSTDLDDQKNSFNAQLEEYSSRILRNPEWEFVKLYSDEGISGTSLKKREGFKEMIQDALNGKIDLILTKSISRFARNTVDCIQTVRDLQAKNVVIFFEKENLTTDDPKTEMMLTIYASMAQEESKSISENVKWGIRKRMERGVTHIQTKNLLGYDKDATGKIVIDEVEATTVIKIYNLFMAGYTYREICKILTKENLPNGKGEVNWTISRIQAILQNEKYCGDVLLQKTCCTNFLTHVQVKNDGILPKYLVENHHTAIIPKELYLYVQMLRKFRSKYIKEYERLGVNALAGLIFCETCGRQLNKITVHPKKPYAKDVMTCKTTNRKNLNYIECSSSSTLDFTLAMKATSIVVKKYGNFESKLKQVKSTLDQVLNGTYEFYDTITKIKNDIKDLESQIKSIIKKQAKANDYSSYEAEFNTAKRNLNLKKEQLEKIENQKFVEYNTYKNEQDIMTFLNDGTFLSPKIVRSVVSKIIRKKDNSLEFILNDSKEEQEKLLETNYVQAENKILHYIVKAGGKDGTH